MNYAVAEAQVGYRDEPVKKKKKPGFIKRWIQKMARDDYDGSNQKLSIPTINQSPSIDAGDRAIRFTVYNANGGRVIETSRYDRTKDRHHTGLYVITSEADFGRELDKIITQEYLK